MMKGDHKGDLAIILGNMGPSRDDEEPIEDEIDPGLEAAGEELLAAVEAKDARGIASAIKSAYDLCAMPMSHDDE